jgi:AcrR family transcriptional regulator
VKRDAASRREKQQRTRTSLLRAAAKLFCRHGLDGASIDDVAEEAGYTKGAFYANFRNKEELFLVMLDEKFSAELARVDAALTGDAEPRDEARTAAADFIHFVRSDPEWPRLYFQFASYATRNDDFRQELATRQRAMRERLALIYERWTSGFDKAPALPLGDLAAMTFFMADGFLVGQLIEPELDDDLYSTMLGVFFRGLEAMAEDRTATAVATSSRPG